MAVYDDDYVMLKRSSSTKSTTPTKKKAAVKKAPTKTIVTPGTKVSQATINKIKSMGMTAALKSASSANPETREGIRRLYGATRYNKAVASKAAPKPTDSRFSGVKKVDVKKPTDSRFSGVKKAAPKPTDSRFKYNPKSVQGQPAILPTSTKSPTAKKTVVPAQQTRPRFGGFSLAAEGVSKAYAKTPKAQREARNAAAKKNK
jgi:hypothetical protein